MTRARVAGWRIESRGRELDGVAHTRGAGCKQGTRFRSGHVATDLDLGSSRNEPKGKRVNTVSAVALSREDGDEQHTEGRRDRAEGGAGAHRKLLHPVLQVLRVLPETNDHCRARACGR